MVKIVTGPVVGMVTRESIRILLEFDGNVHIDIVATEKMMPESQSTVSRKFYANRPKAVTVAGLKEKTEYIFSFRTNQDEARDEDVDIEQIDEKIRSLPVQKTAIEDAIEHKARAITLGSHLQNIRVAIVSCNDDHQASGAVDLYQIIDEKIARNQMRPLDAIFHVGNQINGDELYKEAIKILENGGDQEAACEVFRAAYRKNYKHKALRDLLGKVGNFFIASERDLGISQTTLQGRDELHEKALRAARRVYGEYQRQLWSNEPLDAPNRGHEGHAHLFGEHLGILFVDQLFGRAFPVSDQQENEYLTQAQWQEIERLFVPAQKERMIVMDGDEEDGGLFARIKGLVVVTNEPLFLLGETTAESVKSRISEKGLTRDNWAQGAHTQERDRLLSLLAKWKSQSPVREVVIVSGNSLKCGGHTLIHTDTNVQMTQFVSSPIASGLALEGMSANINVEGKSDQHTYQHFDWITDERNFGVVDVLHAISISKPLFEHFIIREKSTSISTHGKGGTWQIAEVDKSGCCIIA